MLKFFPQTSQNHRTGITLLEVLIAIGILAIGLSSVAALLPAAGNQAKNAVIADRAASMAENALADAVTIGITKPNIVRVALGNLPAAPTTGAGVGPCNWNRIVIDPLGNPDLSEDADDDGILSAAEDIIPSGSPNNVMDGLMYAGLDRDGIFIGGGSANTDVLKLFSQSRDDLIYNDPATADDLPTNQIENTRAFLGRTSCLWALESLDGNPIASQEIARLSAVVFHSRDASATTFPALINDAGVISWSGSLPSGRSIKQVFRRGTVVVRMNPYSVSTSSSNDVPAMYVLRAAPQRDDSSVYVIADDRRLVEFQSPSTTDEVRILLDSVGLAQRVVTLEQNSEYGLSTERKVTP